MNLLVIGVSHRSADVALLERLSVPAEEAAQLTARLLAQPYLGEVLVLSTCNRVEIYAAVSTFHGGLADIGAILAERAGVPVGDLATRLYAHYGVDAVRHAFRVVAGLDSMVVGETQILGQFRDAYGTAIEHGSVGRLLHELGQQALRTGKRVHAETTLDRAGHSVVSAALELGLRETGITPRRGLVIGAGSVGSLALATLRRAGVTELAVTNRTADRAIHLAATHGAAAVAFTDLQTELAAADIVVTATASPAPVLTALPPRDRPLLILDLAIPRDVAPHIGQLPGVTVVDIAALSRDTPVEADMAAAEDIVAAEIEAFVSWHRGADVAPTVAALRARADDVVAAELKRLSTRLPNLSDEQRAQVAQSVHRVVQRLLHEPTVRVRQKAAEPGGEAYAHLLRDLFNLPAPLDVSGALQAEIDGE